MNIDAYDICEWPRWVDASCRKCGEFVPLGHDHYCDHAVRSVNTQRRGEGEKDAE